MSTNLGSIWSNKTNNKQLSIPGPQVNKPIINSKPKTNNTHSKSYWGTPTWFLFHTIAARINESWYRQNYTIVWEFIKNCCSTLPCPFCRSHAIAFVQRIPINRVSTKKGLQNVLYEFHNVANSNSGKGNQPKNVLEKYNRANIKQIFDLFENRFFRSYIGTRQFNDWQKNEFKRKFTQFYNIVRTEFDI
tara:strand:+ start:112 stop:681 length:570 start_codon:yes stop_codon:yes gene_type:complete